MDFYEFFLLSFVNIVYTCSLFFYGLSFFLLSAKWPTYLLKLIMTEQIFINISKYHRNE